MEQMHFHASQIQFNSFLIDKMSTKVNQRAMPIMLMSITTETIPLISSINLIR